MKSNVVLCVLNRMFPIVDRNSGEVRLPSDDTYYSSDLAKSFFGIQANEAPVKMLIQAAHESGNDIDEVMYLCSNKCAEGIIPVEALSGVKGFPKGYEGFVSAEEFFFERIGSFCRENGFRAPAFNPIPYNPSRPADCLPTLNEYLDDSCEVSVDITGGRRDAVILQTLAIQLLKMQSGGKRIGNIVYSSFEDKTIVRQNLTFELIDLINAIDAFSRYGRADQLNDFFSTRNYVSEETRALCKAMNDFSEAMSLCNMENIESNVRAIQDCLDNTDKALSQKSAAYALVSSALDALDDPDGWICEISLDDALQNIKDSGLEISLDGPEEKLRPNLDEARWKYTIIRSELLLHSLLPRLKSKFIPEAAGSAQLIMNTIIWCVNHQMIQQALCIYREKISLCLFDLGYFIGTPHFNNIGAQKQREILTDLCARCRVGKQEGHYKALYFPRYRDEESYEDYFTINSERYEELLTIMGWYKYLHGIRNGMMHVDTARDNFDYLFGCAATGKDVTDKQSAGQMRADILAALKCIKNPMPMSISDWNRAYSKATNSRSDAASKSSSKVAYSSKREESPYVDSIIELQMLLLKFSDGENAVNWNEFNAWCNHEGKQLNKKSLGLNPNKSFYEGLCDKYPSKFSYKTEDDTVLLIFR